MRALTVFVSLALLQPALASAHDPATEYDFSIFAGSGTGDSNTTYQATYDPTNERQILKGSFQEFIFEEGGRTVTYQFAIMPNYGGPRGDPAFPGGVILEVKAPQGSAPGWSSSMFYILGNDSTRNELNFYRGYEDVDPMIFGKYQSMHVVRFIKTGPNALTVGHGGGTVFCDRGGQYEWCGWGSYHPMHFQLSSR
jgi:hypothetical protein